MQPILSSLSVVNRAVHQSPTYKQSFPVPVLTQSVSTVVQNFDPQSFDPSPTLNRLQPIPSQILLVSFKSFTLQITLDTGATASYIRLDEAIRLGLNFLPNDQLALLADEKTRMASLGEVDFLSYVGNNIVVRVRALIMKNLQASCFGGTTFHADNDITARITAGEILLHNKFLVKQSNPPGPLPLYPPPMQQ